MRRFVGFSAPVAGAILVLSAATAALGAEGPKPEPRRGDRMLAEYFKAETAELAARCLAEVKTLDDWNSRRELYRRQLFEMLGLDPLPERTDLGAVVTGKVERDDFTVEKLYFQSRPRLYVTANLYLPKGLDKPAPAILYVCGHGPVKKNGISFGNKVSYQHHGAWFARHGYVCLVIDTLQMGEIEGIHHGTYREKMWWWNCRGYTPAGVEAWNCIRALDYLQSRKEVDGQRIGVTGRSGGGAYSWWISALDDRIKASVPVAGITDLENHVVDGTVEGHCDCMFTVNTYRWDYAQVAALVAPRPLLLSNSDKDTIFPLEGVLRVHDQVRRIYRLNNAADKLGLLITEGPHSDTQDLQVPAFRWFNRFLKQDDSLVEKAAVPLFQPEELKVFAELPRDQSNTTIQETFTAMAPPPAVPENAEAFARQRDGWLESLRQKAFRGWPSQPGPLEMKEVFSVERHGLRLAACDFTSQHAIRLRLYVVRPAKAERIERVVLKAFDEKSWAKWLAEMQPGFAEELKEEGSAPGDAKAFEEACRKIQSQPYALAFVAPRGVGPTAFDPTLTKQTQIRRRFMLLGQTLDGMQVWDVRRAIQAVRSLDGLRAAPLWLDGDRQMGGIALYASLFEPEIAGLELRDLPKSHREGPNFLNVLRYLDMPQAVAMAAERSRVRIVADNREGWEFPVAVVKKLGRPAEQLVIGPAAPPAK
ncbi:MAG: alpha/beta hydrolase family protein [Pirellulales bacterium]